MDWDFRHDLFLESFSNYESITLSNVYFQKEEIGALELNFENFREVKFQNCKFQGTIFYNAFFSRVKFINCEFNNVVFSECSLNYVVFLNSKFSGVSFGATKLENIDWVESLIQYSKFEACEVGNSKLDDIHFMDNVHRKNKYQHLEFFKCEFYLDKFFDTKFLKCDLKTSHFKEISINLDDFITSTLSILNMIEIITEKGIILEE